MILNRDQCVIVQYGVASVSATAPMFSESTEQASPLQSSPWDSDDGTGQIQQLLQSTYLFTEALQNVDSSFVWT